MASEQFVHEVLNLFPVLNRMTRMLNQRMDTRDAIQVPQSQLQVLGCLRTQGVMNMTQLSQYLMMSRQQMTKTIDSMVEKQLVLRTNDPDNRRQVLIEITAQGHAFTEDIQVKAAELVGGLLNVLEEEDIRQLTGAIVTIRQVFSKIR